MTLTPINEFDIVYISYDEPNADNNWHDLLDKCPWAKRSHGVHGSDAAHKAAAKLSETSRFITVDADNIVDPEFFNLEIDMGKLDRSDVISWAAKNEINGLVYGNGGIKCWPKHVVERMRTHEAAPANNPAAQVDFCWNINYVQMNNVYSHVYNNASPLQAWRAGFREGCKMTLNAGDVVEKHQVKNVHHKNLQRLLVWQSVGADTQNGMWAMYGARLGTVMTNLRRDEWDWHMVRDFQWLNDYWATKIAPQFVQQTMLSADMTMCHNTGYQWDKAALAQATESLGIQCRDELDLVIADLDTQGSKFFKEVYVNPARVPPMTREQDVVNEIGQ
jgi:hypothetical protein